MTVKYLLIDSQNVYQQQWKPPPLPSGVTEDTSLISAMTPEQKKINEQRLQQWRNQRTTIQFSKVPVNQYKTYDYRIDLNEPLLDVEGIKLIDYQISVPKEIELFQNTNDKVYVNSYGEISNKINGLFYNISTFDSNNDLVKIPENLTIGYNIDPTITDFSFNSQIKLDGQDILFNNSYLMSQKSHPSFLLQVNDFELVNHQRIPNIFKTIPFEKLCDHTREPHTVVMNNDNSNINAIRIQLKRLDGNHLTEIDGIHGKFHNSFMFAVQTKR